MTSPLSLRSLVAALTLAAAPASAEIPAPQSGVDDLAVEFLSALSTHHAAAFSLPVTQWDTRPEAEDWTRAALDALETHGTEIVETVPRDIAEWCPAYEANPPELRRAFWVGLMSAIAHYESRHLPHVVGGSNQYFGLMQIYPPTARAVGCDADTGEELKSGEANLACAVQIMAVVVPDHEAIAIHNGGWRGVANQWGPMTRAGARAEMSAWTRGQDYCRMGGTLSASAATGEAFEIAFAAALPPELQAQ